jgi:hypothetical protein
MLSKKFKCPNPPRRTENSGFEPFKGAVKIGIIPEKRAGFGWIKSSMIWGA